MGSSYKAFDTEGSASAPGGYVVRVILIGIPKLAIIVRNDIVAVTCFFVMQNCRN